MFYYEIVFMIYPDKGSLVDDIIKYYSDIINNNGKIDRLENWGLKYLSYNIENCCKAYYVLMNISINKNFIDSIIKDLKINNNILRFMVVKKKNIEKDSSIMMFKKK